MWLPGEKMVTHADANPVCLSELLSKVQSAELEQESEGDGFIHIRAQKRADGRHVTPGT